MEEASAALAVETHTEPISLNLLAPQPIIDETPIDNGAPVLPQMVHNQDNDPNLVSKLSTTNDPIVLKSAPSIETDEPFTSNNAPPNNLNTLHPPLPDPPTHSSSPPSTIPDPPTNNNNNNNDDNGNASNQNTDHEVSHTVLNTIPTPTKPTDLNDSMEIIANDTKSIQETVDNLQPMETLSEQKMNTKSSEPLSNSPDLMDVDEKEDPIAPNTPQNECETINKNSNNDSGIGTEAPIKTQKQDSTNDKEEMDLDEEQEPEPEAPIIVATDPPVMVATDAANPPNTYNDDNPNIQNIQTVPQPSHHKPENNNHNNNTIALEDGYDEEQDEDFNADDEEEDESDEHSEDIDIAGDDDESDNLYSELADIDIVCDDKIYTEEAPRWITFQEDGTDFNVENAYQNWEHDKQQFGTIYSEDGDDDMNDNEEENGGGVDFFTTLLNKYGAKQREDPEKDKIKKKGGDYKLDDTFIDDGDCFEQNGAETVFEGFFIAKGHIDIKNKTLERERRRRKKPGKPLPNIPKTYKMEIEKIKNALQAHSHVMPSIRTQRYMNGVVCNKEMYFKFGGLNTDKEDKKQAEVSTEENTIHIYKSLLLMLLEFDTMLLRAKVSGPVKQAIYRALASIFEYDAEGSNRKQQQNFEELLNWFSYDWYDDTDEVRKGKKMNWRILFLDVFKNRAKARFHNKLNKVRKETKQSDKTNKDKTYKPADIPWDLIVSDIFLMTCYAMESAAVRDSDLDKAAHECHMQLRESISKYLEGGTNDITMADIEKRYNEQTQKIFPNANYCYSYLVVQRIKEIKRNAKKRKKIPKKKTPKKSKTTPQKKAVVDVDLTYNTNHNGSTNTNGNTVSTVVPSPPPLQSPLSVQIGMEPQPPSVSFGVSNDVIDLTGNESNGNTRPTTNSETITATANTPKTEQKSSSHNRKRRRSEIEEVPQHINPFGKSNSNSPPNKRRKLTEKAEFYNPSQPQLLSPGTLIAVQESNGLHNGATVCLVVDTSHEGYHGVRYKYYETGTTAAHCAPLHFCYFVDEYSISDTRKQVLALRMNENDEYEAMYVLATVTQRPEHRNDVIGIKYDHNRKEIQMPLSTALKTVAFERRQNVPTVIPIVPVHTMIKTNADTKSNVHKKDNGYTNGHTDSKRSKSRTNLGPPSSNTFYCDLPRDPWNDRHFQGEYN